MDSRNVVCLLLFIGVGTAKIHLQISNNDTISPYKICVNEGLETERCSSGIYSFRSCLNLSLEIDATDEVLMRLVNNGKTLAAMDGRNVKEVVKYTKSYSTQKTPTPLIFEKVTQTEGEYLWIYMGNHVMLSSWNFTPVDIDEAVTRKVEVFCGKINDININLDENRDINSLDSDNATALVWAVMFGDFELVQDLIRKGADVTRLYMFRISIIHFAAISDNEDILNILLNNGARADVVAKNGITPLFAAAEAGSVNIGKKLLSLFSASINITDLQGRTPLHEAAKLRDPAFVDFLVSSGADIMARDKLGQTALHVAAAKGAPAVIQSLVRAGIPIDDKNKQERTPLMLASEEGQKNNVQTLIKLGAKVTAADSTNKTALDYAKEDSGVKEILQNSLA